MIGIIILIALTIFLQFLIYKALYKNIIKIKHNYTQLNSGYLTQEEENKRLKRNNLILERFTEDTIALYDITKDICKTLKEDDVFSIFKERINNYIKIGDCRFLKTETELSQYSNYTVLPLTVNGKIKGYLAYYSIDTEDKSKFTILYQQFLLGMKRAFLYQEVQELTLTDTLTQAFNRRYFLEKVNEELKRSIKFELKFSFLMVDIDNFKRLNDNYGHLVGDAVLREATKTIKENLRQIDFIGRYGGEELSIILPETDKNEASFAAGRIREAIESRHFLVYDEDLRVTISIGVATFPDDGSSLPELIERSDAALYKAKQSGRNRVCIFGR
jgi:diguanylate cyclase (GGDEF)-like protein